MKTLAVLVLLASYASHAQEYTEQQMFRKTTEAIAKFYGLDIIGDEALRKIQYKVLPKEYHEYIPVIGTLGTLVIHQKLVYRREF